LYGHRDAVVAAVRIPQPPVTRIMNAVDLRKVAGSLPMTLTNDGFGTRRPSVDSAGRAVEVLTLRDELVAHACFEFALRERIGRLTGFGHPAFQAVLGLERVAPDSLTIVSGALDGACVADIIGPQTASDIGSSVRLIAQLVRALAALHAVDPEITHGAVCAERLTVTRDAQLVVGDYVLGSALEQLRYPADRYWADLHVALPNDCAAFDQKLDLFQTGVVALELLCGRRLTDDERRSADARRSVVAALAATGAFGGTAGLDAWLARALQTSAPFASSSDARDELDVVLADSGSNADAPVTWIACAPVLPADAVAERRADAALGPAVDEHLELVPVPAVCAPAAADHVPGAASESRASTDDEIDAAASAPPTSGAHIVLEATCTDHRADPIRAKHRWRNGKIVFIAAAILLAFAIGARSYAVSARAGQVSAAVPRPGTLLIATTPTAAEVLVDSVARGTAPIKVSLAQGAHTVLVRTATAERQVSVQVRAGADATHYIELPTPPNEGSVRKAQHTLTATHNAAGSTQTRAVQAAAAGKDIAAARDAAPSRPAFGSLLVSSPFPVEISEHEHVIGRSGTAPTTLPAGMHQLTIANDALGFRSTARIQVTARGVAELAVDAPVRAIAINAIPWADVVIDGRPVGQTPLGNIPVAVGVHDVVFRHPTLGEQHRRVSVPSEGNVRVTADMSAK